MGRVDKKNKNKIRLMKKVEDFKKVKPKVGKKLKKMNETLPQVKQRKIVLKSQFSENKVLSEIKHFKLDNGEEILGTAKINELHNTIISTLHKSRSDKSSSCKDSLIIVCQLLKSLSHNATNVCHQIFIRSTSDIVEIVSPLLVHPELDVRLNALKLFEMVLKEPMMKMCSCLTHPIVSSNLFRCLSNQSCCAEGMLLIDLLVENNNLFILSVSNKLINALLQPIKRQNCAKSQSSMQVDKMRQNLKMPNRKMQYIQKSINRLTSIIKVLTNQLQSTDYLYYLDLFNDSILSKDETCLETMGRLVKIMLQILRNILLPIPIHNYCFEVMTCTLLQICLTFIEVLLKFSFKAIRSTSALVKFYQENFTKQFAELTGNFSLNITQKISKRGKWTGEEKDMSLTINRSILQIKQFIEQFFST